MTTYLLSNSSAVHCIIKSTESHGLSHGKIHRNLCGGERTDELCSPTSIKYALTLLFRDKKDGRTVHLYSISHLCQA
jgi:hypothetical protein